MRARAAEALWLTLWEPHEVSTFDDAARLAGIEELGRAWTEVESTRARVFLTGLLHRDLAYKSDVMPLARAQWLAGEFLSSFGKFGTRFATNSQDLPHEFPFSWSPATNHTFDAGIVVLAEQGAGLFWVADED